MSMKIYKIMPQGYCNGVKHAIKIANEAINNGSIHFLGDIIHNKHVNEYYVSKGAIIHEGKTRLEMLDEIKEGKVLITAHGASKKVYQKAKEKNLEIIDATCPIVNIVHENIAKYLEKNYYILYIGKNNHPETEGVLGISNKIKLIEKMEDLKGLNIHDNTYVTTQTTLSVKLVNNITEKIKEINDKVIIDTKICNATYLRQKAVLEMPKCDLCIIVGDKKSSNTNELYQIASQITKAILVENVNELKSYKLDYNLKINITSGASTPESIVDEIIDYLNLISG